MKIELAIQHLPRRPTRTNAGDLLAKALADLPPWLIDRNEVLRYFANTVEFNGWLISSVRHRESNLGFVTGPIDWQPAYYSTTNQGLTTICRGFSFCTRPNPPNMNLIVDELRDGAIWIDGMGADNLRIEYLGNNIAAFRFRWKVFIQACISPHVIVGAQVMMIPHGLGSYCSEYWSAPLPIELKTFRAWTKGQPEDLARGVKIAASDRMGLRYGDSPYLPRVLFELIRGLGNKPIDRLFKLGCLEYETWRILAARLEVIDQYYQALESSVKDPDKSGPDGNAAPQIGQASPGSASFLPAHVEALATIRRKDIEGLKKVLEAGEAYLTTIQWKVQLGYKSTSGPPHFFKRMEKEGLIITKKGPGGVGLSVRLSERGKRVVAAAY